MTHRINERGDERDYNMRRGQRREEERLERGTWRTWREESGRDRVRRGPWRVGPLFSKGLNISEDVRQIRMQYANHCDETPSRVA